MADYVDIAHSEEENFRMESLRSLKDSSNNDRKIVPEGYCHACFEDVGEKQLFCDRHCAVVYELRAR